MKMADIIASLEIQVDDMRKDGYETLERLKEVF